MRITFVLPLFPYAGPTGGYKVAFEYGNHLANWGHEVTIVLSRDYAPAGDPASRLKAQLWRRQMHLRHRPLIPWFQFHPKVKLHLAPDLQGRHIPDGDVVVATAWQTAEMVAKYPSVKGVKHYLIYDYEYYMTAPEETRRRMADTYRAGFRMIATSPAVQEMLAENGAVPSAYIPCGLDFATYCLQESIEGRPHGVIGMPVRPQPFKGTADAVTAAGLLRERYGDHVTFRAFGSQRPDDFPAWIEFIQYPSDSELCRFYNALSIFLFPSHYEGWGIPGTEALACGAALVASDSVGLRDYARDGQTALVVPHKRPDLLAQAVGRLLEDDDLRMQLAQTGHEHVMRYTWERAASEMEKLFLSAGAASRAAVREQVEADTPEVLESAEVADAAPVRIG
jgi:L-malate glycosyltransferase